MRIGVVGMVLDFGAEIDDGLGNLPFGFLECTEVHMDAGKVRSQPQHFPILS